MDCHCETHELDCIDAELPLTRVLNGSGCVDIGLLVADSTTLNLTAGASLTAEAIASADTNNTLEVRADGLYVPNPYIAAQSGATGDTWTETSTTDVLRQSFTLNLRDGTWFVMLWWSAWIKKLNQTAGAETLFRHRLRIDGVDGPLGTWGAEDMEGVLIRPSSRVSLRDSWGLQRAGNQSITVGIASSISTSGVNNQVQVFNSRVQALAILR